MNNLRLKVVQKINETFEEIFVMNNKILFLQGYTRSMMAGGGVKIFVQFRGTRSKRRQSHHYSLDVGLLTWAEDSAKHKSAAPRGSMSMSGRL